MTRDADRRRRAAAFLSWCGCGCLVLLSATTSLWAAGAADLYGAALAHERQLRAPAETAATLAQLRDAIGAYERIVREYPRSGYSDNALWQAAGLSIEAFDRYHDPADRARGLRLLRLIQTEYASSSLVPRIPERLAALSDLGAPVEIRRVRREPFADLVRVSIELSGQVRYVSERLEGPARLYFDLYDAVPLASVAADMLAFDDGDVVGRIRVGRHPDRTRLVLDLEDVDDYSVYTLNGPPRLVVDAIRNDRRQRQQAPPSPGAIQDARVVQVFPEPVAVESRPLDPIAHEFPREPDRRVAEPLSWIALHDALYPGLGTALSGADADVAAASVPTRAPATSPVAETASPTAPRANTDGALSLARQLGLGVRRIVIDPGHGGFDPGARAGDLTESSLVLDVALRLEARLRAHTDIDVVLTRRDDVFVPLRARPELANEVGADLFLSIHANASDQNAAAGIETYVLDFASDAGAQAVAARENAISSDAMNDLSGLVESLTLDSNLGESRDLADVIQRNLVSHVRDLHPAANDLGVKRAPFVVLIGAHMPSVLAEISFLTNTEEAGLLATGSYRDRIADGLLQSILEYQQALKPPTQPAGRSDDRP